MYFEVEGIDNEAFKLLSDEDIKELIPKIGPRLKFIEKYRKYINNVSVCLTNVQGGLEVASQYDNNLHVRWALQY